MAIDPFVGAQLVQPGGENPAGTPPTSLPNTLPADPFAGATYVENPQQAKERDNAFRALGRFADKTTEKLGLDQYSYGGQQTLIDLGQLLGVYNAQQAQQMKAEMPQPEGAIQSIGNVLGQYTAPGEAPLGVAQPVQQGMAAAGRALKHPAIAQHVAPITEKIAETAAAVGKSATAVLRALPKRIAQLKAMGLNEEVYDLIGETPSILFKPTKTDIALAKETAAKFAEKKKDLGLQVDFMKNVAKHKGANLELPYENLIDDLSRLKSELSAKAQSSGIGKTFDEFINTVRSGGTSTSPTNKPVKGINIEQAQNILSSIDDTPAYTAAINARNSGQTISGAEQKILAARDAVKQFVDAGLDALDDDLLKRGVTLARGQYADLMRQKEIVGALSPTEVLSKFRSAIRKDNPLDLAALKAILPPDLLRENIARVLNASTNKLESATTVFGVGREITGAIAHGVTKTAATLAGDLPKYGVGLVPRTAYKAKAGLGKVVKKGLSAGNPIFWGTRLNSEPEENP